MILPCDCKNSYQDSLYGTGKRVFNTLKDNTKHRCSNCLVIKSHVSIKVDSKKK